jgi:hypothetical protein
VGGGAYRYPPQGTSASAALARCLHCQQLHAPEPTGICSLSAAGWHGTWCNHLTTHLLSMGSPGCCL